MDLELARTRLFEYLSHEIKDKRVLEAMAHVPRELFIPSSYYHLAYEDIPLSIGFEQTISQPYIIAKMTESLKLKGSEKVLEIGTGSGYQTAILARLAKHIVSVERIPHLAESSRQLLDRLGYTNVEIHTTDKTLGWPAGAPYDAIIVTAAAPHSPQTLLDQLALEGKLVIPVGSRFEQDLLTITKKQGRHLVENLGGCRFVPLIGEDAWEE